MSSIPYKRLVEQDESNCNLTVAKGKSGNTEGHRLRKYRDEALRKGTLTSNEESSKQSLGTKKRSSSAAERELRENESKIRNFLEGERRNVSEHRRDVNRRSRETLSKREVRIESCILGAPVLNGLVNVDDILRSLFGKMTQQDTDCLSLNIDDHNYLRPLQSDSKQLQRHQQSTSKRYRHKKGNHSSGLSKCNSYFAGETKPKQPSHASRDTRDLSRPRRRDKERAALGRDHLSNKTAPTNYYHPGDDRKYQHSPPDEHVDGALFQDRNKDEFHTDYLPTDHRNISRAQTEKHERHTPKQKRCHRNRDEQGKYFQRYNEQKKHALYTIEEEKYHQDDGLVNFQPQTSGDGGQKHTNDQHTYTSQSKEQTSFWVQNDKRNPKHVSSKKNKTRTEHEGYTTSDFKKHFFQENDQKSTRLQIAALNNKKYIINSKNSRPVTNRKSHYYVDECMEYEFKDANLAKRLLNTYEITKHQLPANELSKHEFEAYGLSNVQFPSKKITVHHSQGNKVTLHSSKTNEILKPQLKAETAMEHQPQANEELQISEVKHYQKVAGNANNPMTARTELERPVSQNIILKIPQNQVSNKIYTQNIDQNKINITEDITRLNTDDQSRQSEANLFNKVWAIHEMCGPRTEQDSQEYDVALDKHKPENNVFSLKPWSDKLEPPVIKDMETESVQDTPIHKPLAHIDLQAPSERKSSFNKNTDTKIRKTRKRITFCENPITIYIDDSLHDQQNETQCFEGVSRLEPPKYQDDGNDLEVSPDMVTCLRARAETQVDVGAETNTRFEQDEKLTKTTQDKTRFTNGFTSSQVKECNSQDSAHSPIRDLIENKCFEAKPMLITDKYFLDPSPTITKSLDNKNSSIRYSNGSPERQKKPVREPLDDDPSPFKEKRHSPAKHLDEIPTRNQIFMPEMYKAKTSDCNTDILQRTCSPGYFNKTKRTETNAEIVDSNFQDSPKVKVDLPQNVNVRCDSVDKSTITNYPIESGSNSCTFDCTQTKPIRLLPFSTDTKLDASSFKNVDDNIQKLDQRKSPNQHVRLNPFTGLQRQEECTQQPLGNAGEETGVKDVHCSSFYEAPPIHEVSPCRTPRPDCQTVEFNSSSDLTSAHVEMIQQNTHLKALLETIVDVHELAMNTNDDKQRCELSNARPPLNQIPMTLDSNVLNFVEDIDPCPSCTINFSTTRDSPQPSYKHSARDAGLNGVLKKKVQFKESFGVQESTVVTEQQLPDTKYHADSSEDVFANIPNGCPITSTNISFCGYRNPAQTCDSSSHLYKGSERAVGEIPVLCRATDDVTCQSDQRKLSLEQSSEVSYVTGVSKDRDSQKISSLQCKINQKMMSLFSNDFECFVSPKDIEFFDKYIRPLEANFVSSIDAKKLTLALIDQESSQSSSESARRLLMDSEHCESTILKETRRILKQRREEFEGKDLSLHDFSAQEEAPKKPFWKQAEAYVPGRKSSKNPFVTYEDGVYISISPTRDHISGVFGNEFSSSASPSVMQSWEIVNTLTESKEDVDDMCQCFIPKECQGTIIESALLVQDKLDYLTKSLAETEYKMAESHQSVEDKIELLARKLLGAENDTEAGKKKVKSSRTLFETEDRVAETDSNVQGVLGNLSNKLFDAVNVFQECRNRDDGSVELSDTESSDASKGDTSEDAVEIGSTRDANKNSGMSSILALLCASTSGVAFGYLISLARHYAELPGEVPLDTANNSLLEFGSKLARFPSPLNMVNSPCLDEELCLTDCRDLNIW
ncbi:hypothetical protein BgiMline_030832 [Biomphalaria glabrata]|nr:hypothetical protein BgiMline_019132 [Biomphalaria glabrata]